MIMVDSSVLIDWLNLRISPAERLEPWIRGRQITSCGIIRCEVIRGIRDAAVKSRTERFFELIPESDLDSSLWSEVCDEIWTSDRAGQVLPLTDAAIAICCRRHNATIISTDPHFLMIPGLRVATTLPAFKS